MRHSRSYIAGTPLGCDKETVNYQPLDVYDNVNTIVLWRGSFALLLYFFLFILLSLVFVSFLSLTWFSFSQQLVSGDGAHTDAGSVADSVDAAPPLERTGGIGDSRPPSYQSV